MTHLETLKLNHALLSMSLLITSMRFLNLPSQTGVVSKTCQLPSKYISWGNEFCWPTMRFTSLQGRWVQAMGRIQGGEKQSQLFLILAPSKYWANKLFRPDWEWGYRPLASRQTSHGATVLFTSSGSDQMLSFHLRGLLCSHVCRECESLSKKYLLMRRETARHITPDTWHTAQPKSSEQNCYICDDLWFTLD